jgi:hypothetical protein
MKPGMRMVFEASITSPCAGKPAPTAAIFFPWISTSPCTKLPTSGSMLTMVPPFRRMRWLGPPGGAASRDIKAAVVNAAPDLKKPRREGAWVGIGNLEAMLTRS